MAANQVVAMTLARVMTPLRRLQMLVQALGPDGLSANEAEALLPVARACEKALRIITKPKEQNGLGSPVDDREQLDELVSAAALLAQFTRDLHQLRFGSNAKEGIHESLRTKAAKEPDGWAPQEAQARSHFDDRDRQ